MLYSLRASQYTKNSPKKELRSYPDLDPDLDDLESHIVVNVSSTSNIIPSFIKIKRKKIFVDFLAKFEVT